MSEDQVRALREDPASMAEDDRQRAILSFAKKMAADPDGVNEADIQALRDQGLDNAAIMEVVAVLLMSAFTNTLAKGLKLDQDLERFGMRASYF